MDFNPLDLILHLDTYLDLLVNNYGPWIYAILFLVIFCETGLVVMPFLPGDSLLFIAGAVAAGGGMDPVLLCGLLMAAAILGDSTNYVIGRTAGERPGNACSATPTRRSSAATTCSRPTTSTNAMAARPSPWRASCRSCAPSRRSSPAWQKWSIRVF